jgi:hypothetical protein
VSTSTGRAWTLTHTKAGSITAYNIGCALPKIIQLQLLQLHPSLLNSRKHFVVKYRSTTGSGP